MSRQQYKSSVHLKRIKPIRGVFDTESVKAKMETCLKVYFIFLAIDNELLGKYKS